MRKALPFLVAPKTEIRAVGNPEIGIIHLQKKGGISPNENPIDLQKVTTRQAEVQLMLQKAIARLAEVEKIPKAEARKRLFSSPIRDAETGEAAEDELPSLYDHLTPEETRELLTLQSDQSETALKAAALFIKYRVAYPVQLLSAAKPRTKSLDVSPLSFAIEDGQKIKFGGVHVTVDGVHEVGEEVVRVREFSQALPAEKIGYLCDLETGRILVGDAEWSIEDTKECMSESLIMAIYTFYQFEASGMSEQDTKSEDESGKTAATESLTVLALSSSEG